MVTTFIGIISALVAGLLNGSFATPMKRTTKWQWENTWLMWAVWALVIVPWIIALATVPDLIAVYNEAAPGVIILTILLGAGWGAGAITFGLGMHMVGLSLGFSIIIGITAVTGALIPMLIFSPEAILTSGGAVIILAMLITILGVGFCGSAGMIKERGLQSNQEQLPNQHKFKTGFLVCLASGILNAMLNLSLVAGSPIAEITKQHLADSAAVNFRASNSIWVLALAGAFVTNLLYCGYLLLRKGSWKNYKDPSTKTYWFWTFLMGLLWMTGIMLYGAGAASLGKIGFTIAWIILMATTVLVGNLWGLLTGEWRGVSRKALQRMAIGLILLIGSIIAASLGRYLSE
ncbi:MAG: L-rhamnose/proton symporter RhaT [Planctomycetota bacterium]